MDESISNIRRIPVLLARRDQSRTAVEKLRQKILIPDSISQAVSQFNRLCESYKIKLRSVNFSTDTLLIKNREAGSNESFDLPVLLEFEGRYLDAGMLMERSGDLGFIINFTDFNVTAQERSEKLKFQIRACLRVAVSRNVNGVRR
jgi:Tfp pilus assembly protein PilO